MEQTAGVVRGALGEVAGRPNGDNVLEHHATFDWDSAIRVAEESGRGSTPVDRLRRAAETWDAPVVVTTAVRFFESLFANRTSRCRKLHNLATSVIVLDEAQTLPLPTTARTISSRQRRGTRSLWARPRARRPAAGLVAAARCR